MDYFQESAHTPTFVAIESVFVAIFTIELCLNLFGFGWIFFQDAWNIADFMIVLTSWIEIIAFAAGGGGSTTVVRLLRIMRVTGRLARIGRIVAFYERLAVLCVSFLQSMKSVCWVLLLIVLVLYVFAVLGVELFKDATELQAKLKAGGNGNIDLKRQFGTIPRAMVTLLQYTAYDNHVGDEQRPIGEIWPATWIYFVAVMCVIVLGLFQLLAAVFVDTLLEEMALKEKQKQRDAADLKREFQQVLESSITLHRHCTVTASPVQLIFYS